MRIEEYLKSDDVEIVQLYSKIYLETHSIQELDKLLDDTIYYIHMAEPLSLKVSISKVLRELRRGNIWKI